MTITVKHKFVSAIPDEADATVVRPSNWNDDHDLVGTIPVANGGTGASDASTARTNLGLGTIATQNANSVAITGGNIDGTTIGATTPAVITGSTINANTKVVSPDFYAQSVLGGNLRTSGGTSLVNWDGGGSGNVTVNGGLIASPANKNITLSPSGTGTVTVNPATTGAIDNVVIGATTPKAITGTTVTATNFVGSGASLTNVVNSAGAGTGISVSGATGAVTITNTAPDQTVSLTAGTGISTSGTYPNFTITNTSPSSGGTVTSVAATVPSFLSVSGSPITSSGTLALTYSGTALPVANGGTGVTTSTGSGSNVLNTSPTLNTPAITGGTIDNTPIGATTANTIRGTTVLGTTSIQVGATDVVLNRDAANTLAQRNSTNAQTFRLYNTYTDASNYERLGINWSSNTATIQTENAGTGSARNLAIGQDLYVNSVRVGLGGGANSVATVVGSGAMAATNTGVNNAAFGYFSLHANTSGNSNSSFGAYNTYNNTTGLGISSFGNAATGFNISGNYLTAVGAYSLYNNTTASNLTAIGYQALNNNTTNVATLGTITGGTGYTNGTYTGVVMTLSSGSTAVTYPTATIVVAGGVVTTVTLTSNGVGFKDTTTVLTAPAASIGGTGSGFTVPVATLASGTGNVAVGYQAGYGNNSANKNTTGSNNTYIGYQTVGSANNNTNEMVIGYTAVGLGSNTTVIGNTNTTLTQTYGVTKSTNYTVATLPSASTSGVGARAFVTDALAPTFGSAVTGGGAVPVPVYIGASNTWYVG